MHLALILLAALSLQAPAPDLTVELDAALGEVVARHRLPGLAVGLVRDGEVVYARGFGVALRGSERPVTTGSIFHMASVSKLFTATAVQQLVEAGKLELDATLTTYLPYFRMDDERSGTITLRQVLTHTSGIPDVRDYEWERPQHDAGAAERYVRSLGGETLLFAPGSSSRYSNMGFDILGDVIAKASGMSFDDYVKARILAPLGMSSTSFIHAETPEAQWTQGHSLAFAQRIDGAACPVYPYNRRHAPSSTLNSNVDDMCRWALANLARGELDGERILSEESYEVMWSRGDDTPGIGLSWFLDDFAGRPSAQHSGADVGFSSFLRLLPGEGLAVVVMVNTDQSPVGAIAQLVLLAALGEDYTLPRPSIAVEFAHVLEGEGLGPAIERFFELQEGEPQAWTFGFEELDFLCEVLISQERFPEAVEVAAVNSDVYYGVSTVHARLGQALAASGDPQSARECFEHALELNPRDALASEGLAQL